MDMNPIKEKCIDLAEHYDIDWYTGEFASVFWNRHDNSDESTLNQLSRVHEQCCVSNATWGAARTRMIACLEEIQGRSPSVAGDPSWLRGSAEASPPVPDGNVSWRSATDPLMVQAICKAQVEFLDFKARFRNHPFDEFLMKAFFAHPADPMVGEHIYIDSPEISDTTIQGVLWFESTQIPGITSGDKRSIDITRLSDWFVVIAGNAYGGYTLPVLAEGMTAAELSAANEYPPFKWFASGN